MHLFKLITIQDSYVSYDSGVQRHPGHPPELPPYPPSNPE